jgi:hypothetical protein
LLQLHILSLVQRNIWNNVMSCHMKIGISLVAECFIFLPTCVKCKGAHSSGNKNFALGLSMWLLSQDLGRRERRETEGEGEEEPNAEFISIISITVAVTRQEATEEEASVRALLCLLFLTAQGIWGLLLPLLWILAWSRYQFISFDPLTIEFLSCVFVQLYVMGAYFLLVSINMNNLCNVNQFIHSCL